MSSQHQSLRELTKEQGYAAMFEFLQLYWEYDRSDDIAILLGALALQPDGRPADPALWADWIIACEKVLEK